MRFSLVRFLPGRRPLSHRLGRTGERVAVRALRRRGYRILGRNVRTPEGEIDVLALDGRMLVVVEVKTRAAGGRVRPEPRVSAAQRRRLARAARWVARRASPRPAHVRLELVAVTIGTGGPEVSIRPERGGPKRPVRS